MQKDSDQKPKDFQRFGETIEANGLRMHATNLGAQPTFYLFSTRKLFGYGNCSPMS